MIDYDTEHDWQWPNPKTVRWVMPMKGYQAAISVGAIERLLESTLPRISQLAPTQQPQPISCSPVLLFGSMNCFAGLGRDWDFETKVVGRPSFSQGYNVRCRLNRHRLMRGRLKIWQEQQGGGGVSRCWARKREWGVCVFVF